MTGCKFVDTNILLYANDNTAGEKQTKSAKLLRELWETREGVLSTQVLQEFFYNATRKLSLPLNVPVARGIVQAYSVWLKGPISDTTLIQQFSVWLGSAVIPAGKPESRPGTVSCG